jgi:excinuclease UvrABC helicase subunit UvrB
VESGGLQRCLNLEQAEQAEMLRAKIEEVQAAIASHAAKKRGAAQAMAQAASDTSATDRAALGLQLKSDLARAIEEERYQDAAALRDRLAGACSSVFLYS